MKVFKILICHDLSLFKKKKGELTLPPELFCEIFNLLNLEQLIKCNLVNKYWHSIVNDLIKVKRLVVGRHYSRKWYFTKEFIKEEIECCHLNLFLTQYKRSFLANLNYLCFDPRLSNFDLNIVNLFTRLVHFELNILTLKRNAIIKLNLPNLQVFSFYANRDCNLTIDCPKLKVLRYKSYDVYDNLDIKHLDSIIHLETKLYDEKLKGLKNIEYLRIQNYQKIDENILSNLSNLKEFHFDLSIDGLFLDLFRISTVFDHVKDCLRRFMNRKRSLRMYSLKVFFLGIQLVDNEDEINFDGLQQRISEDRVELNLEKFCMDNYNRFKYNLKFICRVDYNNLMAVANEIPTDYFKKFYNLQAVTSIGRIINQEHFLEFLKSVKNLNELMLEYPNLNQSIYDRLPESCSLKSLKLKEGHQLNFDFTTKFKELKMLFLNQNVSLEVVKSLIGPSSLVTKLNYKLGYVFNFNKIKFQIWKDKGNGIFKLVKIHNLIKENASSNEIINYFEQLN